MTRAFPWRPLCELYVCEITLLLTLNALSVGLRQRSTQTNTASERKYFHCDVPPWADTRKILSDGSPPIHTHTHHLFPLHLWLHLILGVCGCVKILVCVCCELDFLFVHCERLICVQWFTNSTTIVRVCTPKQSQRPHTHLQTQHTPTLDHSRSQPHAHTSSCWLWLMAVEIQLQ